MKTITSIYSAIYLILAQLIILNIVKSEFFKQNNNTSSWKKSSRSKRSLFDRMPNELKIKIKYREEQEIDLTWVKKEQYVANEYLPVITPIANFNPNVMKDIGEIIVYHDEEKCSAVVYFEKFNTFYGTIGMNYFIQHLPFHFNDEGVFNSEIIGEPYVRKHNQQYFHINPEGSLPPPSDMDAWDDFLRSTDSNSNNLNRKTKRRNECDAGPSAKHQRTQKNSDEKDTNTDEYKDTAIQKPQEYYLETLIFVANDVAQIFKYIYGRIHYIQWIVRYYIIYFNTVNMYFHKLTTEHARVHINIAKIIIEDELLPFNFIHNAQHQFQQMVTNLQQYLNIHQPDYPPDSFDYIFVHISSPIVDEATLVSGITKRRADLYEARKSNNYYDVVPITIIRFNYFYADHTVAVHEIGRVENRNRCFLINEPRSLRSNRASRFLSPDQQCQCFGYDSYNTNSHSQLELTVGLNGCSNPLRCKELFKSIPHYVFTVRPFDGTPCTNNKVCWKGQCILY